MENIYLTSCYEKIVHISKIFTMSLQCQIDPIGSLEKTCDTQSDCNVYIPKVELNS